MSHTSSILAEMSLSVDDWLQYLTHMKHVTTIYFQTFDKHACSSGETLHTWHLQVVRGDGTFIPAASAPLSGCPNKTTHRQPCAIVNEQIKALCLLIKSSQIHVVCRGQQQPYVHTHPKLPRDNEAPAQVCLHKTLLEETQDQEITQRADQLTAK
jgi:hypothetical protein